MATVPIDTGEYFNSVESLSRFQSRLAGWLRGPLDPITAGKVRGTLSWLRRRDRHTLPLSFWFSHADVHRVLRGCPHVGLWEPVLCLPAWSDWFSLQGLSDTARLTGRLPVLDLHRQLASSSLQGLLAARHFSPWNIPAGTADRLFPLLRKLLHSVIHDPCIPELPAITLTTLAHGLPGVVIRSASNTPAVPVPPLPLSRSIPWSTDLSPDTAVPYPLSTELSSAPVPIPPSTSLLLRPGRALTLADFPEPSASASSDDSSATPYHPRFVTAVRAPPDPPVNFRSPLGIWPSAAVRRRTSPEWYTALLDPQPATLTVHGYQPLRSTGGSFSVLTALLATYNHGPDTVLTFWKRAEGYLQYAWKLNDCYPTDMVNIHNSHSLGGVGRRVSLARLAGLDLPYVPSLLELFQRLGTPVIHPVLYYVLAGAYSGPLQVIDEVSSSVTWYQVANHSSLLHRTPRLPYLTLLDSRGDIRGTAAPLFGPLPMGPTVSSSLVPFYPPLPNVTRPTEDRNAFGSKALKDYLSLQPDAFELTNHWQPGAADDFRVTYFNINGLDGFKLAELLAFMSSSCVDCLVLIDARVPQTQSRYYLRETRAELGPGAVCLVSSPTDSPLTTSGESIKVGGNVIILNDRWGPSLINFKSDPSQLCLVDEVTIGLPSGRLQLLATYWPFPPRGTDTDLPLEDSYDQRAKRGLYHRLSAYLRTTHSRESSLQYVQQTIQHWSQRHLSVPGNHSICGGDFNACWQGRPDGVGYTEPLQQWAESIGYKSRHTELPGGLHYITRPSTNLLGGTEIDHVLFNSPLLRLSQYETGGMGLWVSMSDHRPVVVAFSGLPVSTRPRFTQAYGLAQTLQLRRFRPSAPQLKQFTESLTAAWVRLDTVPSSTAVAEAQLLHLTDITLAAAPDRKKWKCRNRYKEHWSPTFAALQAQTDAVVKIQRHLGVLPLPRRLRAWTTPLDIQLGISRAVGTWERVVESLDFHHGVPPEVWGTGLTPQAWRTQDVSNLNGLKLAAVSNFRLLLSNLHARKNKERAIRLSPHIAQREDNIAGANMHLGIQSLLNELQPEIPFEQYDFGSPELAPTTPADLHTYMTEMFRIHFQAQPTSAPDLQLLLQHSPDLRKCAVRS